MTTPHRGTCRDVVGINAGLIHRFNEYIVQTHILARLGNQLSLRISDDTEQFLCNRRHQNHPQILIDRDNAVLHLRHNHAQRMIMAALLENPALDSPDDRIVFRNGIVVPVNQFDARVEIAVGKFVQRVHCAIDQPGLGIHRTQHGDKHARRKYGADQKRNRAPPLPQRRHSVYFFR